MDEKEIEYLISNSRIRAFLLNLADSYKHGMLEKSQIQDVFINIKQKGYNLSRISYKEADKEIYDLSIKNEARKLQSKISEDILFLGEGEYLTITTADIFENHIMSEADRITYKDLLEDIKICQDDFSTEKERVESENILLEKCAFQKSTKKEHYLLMSRQKLKPDNQQVWLSTYLDKQCRTVEFFDCDQGKAMLARDLLGLDHYYEDRFDNKVLVCIFIKTSCFPNNFRVHRPSAMDGGNERFRVGDEIFRNLYDSHAGYTVDLNMMTQDEFAVGCKEYIARPFIPQDSYRFTVLGRVRKGRKTENSYENYLSLLEAKDRRKYTINDFMDEIWE